MFKPKFTNSSGGFTPRFVQDKSNIDTNFDVQDKSNIDTNFDVQDKSNIDTNFKEYGYIKGEDGFSPDVEVVEVGDGHIVTITDKDGSNQFEVKNGKDGYTPIKGIDYNDGYTPVRGMDYFTEEDKRILTSAVIDELPVYTGAHSVIPDANNETTLGTQQMIVGRDIIVQKIPYAEVSNNSNGTTVTIS